MEHSSTGVVKSVEAHGINSLDTHDLDLEVTVEEFTLPYHQVFFLKIR